jgi:hypothetical protein
MLLMLLISLFFRLTNNRSSVIVTASIVIGAIVLDTIMATFYDVLSRQLSSLLGVMVFLAIIIATYGIGQHFLLGYLKRVSSSSKGNKARRYFDIAHNILLLWSNTY